MNPLGIRCGFGLHIFVQNHLKFVKCVCVGVGLAGGTLEEIATLDQRPKDAHFILKKWSSSYRKDWMCIEQMSIVWQIYFELYFKAELQSSSHMRLNTYEIWYRQMWIALYFISMEQKYMCQFWCLSISHKFYIL